MNKPHDLFSLCCTKLWDLYPHDMKNGPKSKQCLFCIKALLHIRDIYDCVPEELWYNLKYHFRVSDEKDCNNEFRLICLTMSDKKMIRTYMLYHVLYQFNFLTRVILPDYVYIVGFAFVNENGIRRNKYNLSCHNMFISSLIKAKF